jgi:hypothetical protein
MELPHLILLAFILQTPSGGPIIVKITEAPKSELSTLSEVLLGSLGLSGALALAAILLGVGLGGLMFWLKRRSA